MISLDEFKSSGNISGIFSKLFQARDFAHLSHLRTKSFAQHKALKGFYEDIIDLADKFYETYAGQYGQQKFEIVTVEEDDIVRYFEDLGRFINESHIAIDKKDTHLHNILDEINGLVYSSLYKLKFLK